MWRPPRHPRREKRSLRITAQAPLIGPPRHCIWYGPPGAAAPAPARGESTAPAGRGGRKRPTPRRHRGRGRKAARCLEAAEREEREGYPGAECTDGRGRNGEARPYLGRRNHRDLLEVVERHGHRHRRATRRKGSRPQVLARPPHIRPGRAGERRREGRREGQRE